MSSSSNVVPLFKSGGPLRAAYFSDGGANAPWKGELFAEPEVSFSKEDFGTLCSAVLTARIEDTDPDEPDVADTTLVHCFEVLRILMRARARGKSIPLPSVGRDPDGFIELEWVSGDRQFSLYVTDTNKIIYAYFISATERGSGYLDKFDAFGDLVIAHISTVFAERTAYGSQG